MGISMQGVGQVQDRLDHLAAGIRITVVSHLQHEEARPLLAAMRTRAHRYGRIGRRAASTLQYHALPNGGSVSAGGTGSSLGVVLFGGSEYGGRKRKKTYLTKSPKGTTYAVTRKTTMMFLPHLGRRGYWYWPTVRRDTKGIVSRVSDVIEQEVNRLG